MKKICAGLAAFMVLMVIYALPPAERKYSDGDVRFCYSSDYTLSKRIKRVEGGPLHSDRDVRLYILNGDSGGFSFSKPELSSPANGGAAAMQAMFAHNLGGGSSEEVVIEGLEGVSGSHRIFHGPRQSMIFSVVSKGGFVFVASGFALKESVQSMVEDISRVIGTIELVERGL